MTLPGFTAEVTLFRPTRNHRARALKQQPGGVFLAMPIGGGSALLRCQADCKETCLDQGFSTAKCGRMCSTVCKDSGIGDPVTPKNPVNCALSKGGCYAWYGICLADPFGFGCSFVLNQCLKDSGCSRFPGFVRGTRKAFYHFSRYC